MKIQRDSSNLLLKKKQIPRPPKRNSARLTLLLTFLKTMATILRTGRPREKSFHLWRKMEVNLVRSRRVLSISKRSHL